MTFSSALYVSYFEHIAESVHRGMPFLLMALATPVVFYCAQPIYRLVWHGFRNGTLRMEALLGLGIGVAYAYSSVQAFAGGSHVFFDTASGIVTAVLAGKVVEQNAKGRAARWISTLHRMLPNKVRILVDGQERFASVAALEAGEVFVVKAGERIAADGRIVTGESHADEALLTGESAPVSKRPGDPVAAEASIWMACCTCRPRDSRRFHPRPHHRPGESRHHQPLASGTNCRPRGPIFVPCVMLLATLTFAFYQLWPMPGSPFH